MGDDRVEEIRHAMWENHRSPNGAARNARAEELVVRAEQTGDSGLLLETLSQLITAYEYSAERSKMFVPFARMLRMWDEDPGRFDDQMAYELFWRFKWVTGSMIDYPEIPLASIEQWLGEMERRYRIAGYNARTVRGEEFWVAWHLGDIPRAEAAHADWLAGDRDRMSNCHACEAGTQGRWEAFHGRDELALERWAEVLAGRLTCAEEPHRVLAYALLPLLRLGRADEARTNHLRGYRMARGNESLLPTVGRHIEFCALTGNEARGLEILAEHARHLAPAGNPDSLLSLLEAAVLLLARLDRLGLGDSATSGPQGRRWTVATLLAHCEDLRAATAAQFDRRNGTDAVSRESEQRIAQQPLLERLPLGVSAVLPGAVAPAARPAPAAAAPVVPADVPFAELLAEARRLRESGDPTARQTWLAVDQAVAAGVADAESDEALLRAELAVERGFRCGREDSASALAHFEQATAAFREAGRPGDALVNEGRAAIALLLRDGPDAVEAALRRADAAADAARIAAEEGRLTPRQLCAVLISRAKALTGSVMSQGGAAEREPALAALAEVIRLAEDGTAEDAAGTDPADLGRLHALRADAHHNRAALFQGQPEQALPELRAAADAFLLAGRPASAAEPLVPLARIHAQLGDLAAAEAVAEEALRHGAGHLDPDDTGRTLLLLADLLGHREAHEDAVRQALEATRWLDEAGLTAGPGAAARHRLALSYRALGRHAEAAEVLQAVLPDLVAQGEQAEVAARRALGESLGELGEHAGAAEQFALAAQIVDGWGEPFPSAQLASSTAEALSAAGRTEQAEAAYLRAQGLWAGIGVTAMVVRTLRARAWMTFRQGRDADPGRALMLEAEQAAREALAVPGIDQGYAEEVRQEHADTWRQLGALLRDVAEDEGWNGMELPPGGQAALYQEAWEAYRAASDAFATCAGPGPARSAHALLDAARILIETGRTEAAAAELRQVQALAAAGGEALAGIGRRAGSMLERLEREAAG